MKRLGNIAGVAVLLATAALAVEVYNFNATHFLYVIPAHFIVLFALTWFINKKAGQTKRVQQKESANIGESTKIPDHSLFPYREYYSSKSSSAAFFIVYTLIGCLCAYVDTFEGVLFLHICMSLAIVLCLLFLWYNYKKWMRPAYRNEVVLSIDEKGLDLKNGYSAILWNEIDSIICYREVVGITIKAPDEFLKRQPTAKTLTLLEFRKGMYGYHFGISLTFIKDYNAVLYSIITSYFERFKDKC